MVTRAPDGKIIHYHGYVFDITKRKHDEEELKKYREHLEELVEKRTAELQGMIDAMARRVVRMADLDILAERLKEQIRSAGLVPLENKEEKPRSP